MDRYEKYERDMQRLGEYLVDEPRTALQVAKKMKVSKPTAYDRLTAWRKRAAEQGMVLRTKRIRQGATGPKSVAYYLDLTDEEKKARRAA